MSSNLNDANTETPTPSLAWRQLSDDGRLALINNTLDAKMPSLQKELVTVEARPDGQVIVQLLDPVPADKRGTLLLDLEVFLKNSIDPGLAVWLVPLGDRNSLRNLRGIEVAS